jgi:DNA-binding response OmpR family regulator
MIEKIKVLLVDDDIIFGTELTAQLNGFGKYAVKYLNSALGISEAIQTQQPDVLVFDVEIDDANGIEIALRLYNGNPELPIIFISSNHTEDVKAKGLLEARAVAYLDKPFTSRALAAYIDRFVREKKKDSDSIPDDNHLKQFGNALLDTRNRALVCENRKIKPLRPMEYAIFKKLTDSFGQTVSREHLMAAVWNDQETFYNDRSLNNYVRRVRKILENDTNLEIELNRQLGYRLVVRQ